MMMDRFMQTVCFLFLSFLSLAAIDIISPCYGNLNVICMESEKQALLTFMKDLKDPSNRLSSWVADNDCCKWAGVVCDNSTAHVRELHLRGPHADYVTQSEYEDYQKLLLGGAINPSLLNLKHLSYLDLSQNNFGGLSIPSFMGSLVSLQYLNLSNAEFGGTIPNQLGNLSGLHSLGLRGLFSYPELKLNVENLQWLSGLSSLKHLDLSYVNLNKTPNWPDMINMLPFLVELHLSNCQLAVIPPLLNVNFTSLAILDLSGNKFNSSIPRWIFTLSSLISLNLGSNNFGGPIPDGRGNLTSLKVLDLSRNNFNSSIPRWIFTLSSLISLNFGSNNFGGPIPDGQGNLTSLKVLDLSWSNFNSSMLRWIFTFSSLVSLDLRGNHFYSPLPSGPTNMTNLRYLDLSYCGINSTIPNWLYSFSRLETLYLYGNYLHGKISSAIDNMTSITTLDLRSNELEGKVPREIGNLCNLMILDLSYNKFEEQEVSELFETLSRCAVYSLKSLGLSGNQLSGHLPDELEPFKNLSFLSLGGNSISGPIPESLGRLSSLEELDLSENQLNGTLPESLGRLSFLEKLDLSENQLNGTLPESLGQLSKLEELDISDNYLEGVVSEVHFANLVGLRKVYASGNQLVLNVSSNWVPPFQLEYLKLRSWQLGPQFPMWLQFMRKDMWTLDLSCTGISDEIPAWFWDFSSTMYYLNLSHNQIRGEIPNLPSVNQNEPTIDLGSNRFSGPLPLVSSNITELDLSNNSFSGGLSHFLCDTKENQNQLAILQIGENHLSGEIPNCWMNWQSLLVIKLENNNLTGTIPNSMGLLGSLRSLHLRNNNLSGEVPLSLQNCTELVMLDISMNEFSGSIPKWNGTTLSNLIVLGLRSNKFLGNIPHELCNLPLLQILDMANNNLSGKIPGCVSKFKAMTIKQQSGKIIYYSNHISATYLENAVVVTKGRENQYDTILTLVTSMDLSNNKISGEIPEEITNLFGLLYLNLSGNQLTGTIPMKIGDMGLLESLDFSRNQISGKIPPSMSKLNFLAYLNLSYNNLSGRIPSSTQLQSFNPSSYVGNKLCGPPVSENCSTDGLLTNNESEGDNEGSKSELYWFYLTIALGFVVGFWGVWGPLLFNRQWRFAYFQFLENMWIKLLVLMRKCF